MPYSESENIRVKGSKFLPHKCVQVGSWVW